MNSVENAPSDDDDAVIHGQTIASRIVVHTASKCNEILPVNLRGVERHAAKIFV